MGCKFFIIVLRYVAQSLKQLNRFVNNFFLKKSKNIFVIESQRVYIYTKIVYLYTLLNHEKNRKTRSHPHHPENVQGTEPATVTGTVAGKWD